ncbi:DUF6090 family protein [Aestuariivivens sp. NBU2969]|uniref:DUF6090 family protein n=1 Tax=Aestuariivivens sp. NBU2969 TaxID=2873267 RepID=UPI001CBD29E3|nr:DUF6090 family protein [Aestuariivivens sp. NBU2969]
MKKQLRYALGEILIVIIGISIAFSLNKCADTKKNENLKSLYIKSLKEDIKVDKKNLEQNLKEINTKIETLKEIIPLINTDSPEKIKLRQELFGTFNITEFYPNDITYQTMINSGDFKLINEFELKAAIEKHYASYKSILKDYSRQENIHKEFLSNYMVNHANYDDMKKGAFGFSNEVLFKNILQSMNGSFWIKRLATIRGIKNCDSLLVILK